MKFYPQLLLLLWKNFTLRKRQKLRCLVELCWPLSLFLLLMWVRTKGFRSMIHECHFEDKPLPSAGQASFYQGLICAFNNTCHESSVKANRNYPHSAHLFSLFRDIVDRKEPDVVGKFMSDLRNLSVQVKNVLNFGRASQRGLGDESETLEELSRFQSANEKLKESLSNVLSLPTVFEEMSALESSNLSLSEFLSKSPLLANITLSSFNFLCGTKENLTIEKLTSMKKAAGFESYLDKIMESSVSPNFEEDPDATSSCNTIYKRLETSKTLKYFWRLMKPFARGKIVFSPDTPPVNRIMSKLSPMVRIPKIPDMEIDEKALNSVSDEVKQYLSEIESSYFESEKIMEDDAVKGYVSDSLRSTIKEASKVVGRLSGMHVGQQGEKIKYGRDYFNKIIECYRGPHFEVYKTESQASVRSSLLCEKNLLLAQVNFLNTTPDALGPLIQYKIRMNADRVPAMRQIYKQGPYQNPYLDMKFFTFGYIYLQDIIEKSIITEVTGRNDTPGIVMKQFPYPCYIDDWFMSSLSFMFPLFMSLSWIYTCSMIVKSIVYEKEQRLKETMSVLGLSNGIHWAGWFIDSIIPTLFTCIILAFVIVYGGIINNADVTVVMVFLFCYALATIFFSFLISTLFSKANIAASAGGIIFFLAYLPFPFMEYWYNFFSFESKAAMCLLSNVALGLGSRLLARNELEGGSIQWSNIDSRKTPDELSFLIVIIMLLVDALIYAILTWYIEGVLPGEYGIPKPWYFPLSINYWRPSVKIDIDTSNAASEAGGSGGCFEDEPNLEKGVVISNMTKVYRSGKEAVSNLSINFYKNQITAFLGKNGAGKTTTISVLTGLFPPSKGTVYIYGLDIRTKMSIIRKNLGFCPQHNILFGDLTVEEHLWFFARLKGRPSGDIQIEVQQMVSDLGLIEKRTCRAKYLSGGMQRKLSIAIAFIGKSMTVILDEPTAGVDPYSRIGIWSLLEKYKRGRTVIMTTHIMSEAELLGDRIAIFSSGKLLCCGSTPFLKSRFSQNYILTIDRLSDSPLNELSDREAEITANLAGIIDGVEKIDDFGTELKYKIPKVRDLQLYQNVIEYLESNKSRLGIRSYGISDTTLEEVQGIISCAAKTLISQSFYFR